MNFKKIVIIFWVAFYKIKARTAILRRFTHNLHKSPQILPGFSPNQNFWGALAPPASYISERK